jgi:hypothetical protein
MIDLERSLGELADRLEIPNGDWMVSDVVRRIGEPQRRPAIGRVPRLAVALVAVLVVALVALPGPRHAVARWLGFDSVRIEPGVTVPPTTSASTTTTQAPPTVSAGSVVEPTTLPVPDLGLGSSISIEEAKLATGLPDPTPVLLGDPQSVHVVQPPATGQIVLVYPPSALVPQSIVIGAGALVSVMPAHIEEGFFQKTLGTTSTVRPVDVNGDVGYWIEGSPHELLFDFDDQIQQDTLRLATNTLLWQRGDHVYRIEADIDLETALQIAKSIP